MTAEKTDIGRAIIVAACILALAYLMSPPQVMVLVSRDEGQPQGRTH